VSTLTYLIGTYPQLTTTFIDREIEGLQAAGRNLEIVALRKPDGMLSDGQSHLAEQVRYVLPAPKMAVLGSHLHFGFASPIRYVRSLTAVLRPHHRTLGLRLRTFLHFGLAVYVAYLLKDKPRHLHAHFVDRATLVAWVASRLLGTTYSATAHANDIYVDPVLLPQKLANAKFVATCTEANRRHLDALGRVVMVRHGLNLAGYPPPASPKPQPPLLLSVAQLKEKKGLDHLLAACRILADRGYRYRCVIVGNGPHHGKLSHLLAELSLGERVELAGALPHHEVIAYYRRAGVFVLPCVVGADGDRDGIPNVILEAMAMELPVVSTNISGIPEAVEDGVTGLLVPPKDSNMLATALGSLLDDPEWATLLGKAGRQGVQQIFDLSTNVASLQAELDRP